MVLWFMGLDPDLDRYTFWLALGWTFLAAAGEGSLPVALVFLGALVIGSGRRPCVSPSAPRQSANGRIVSAGGRCA